MERFAGERGLFLTYEEEIVLLSVLESDSVGIWGDKRHETVERLIKKLKRAKVTA